MVFPLPYTNYLEASDSSVWLWINANGCVQIKYRNNQQQAIFYSDTEHNVLTHQGVEMVFEDSRSNIWLGCVNGLNLKSADKLKKVIDNGRFIKAVEIENNVWFITEQGIIYCFDHRNNKFRNFISIPQGNELIDVVKLNNTELLLFTRTKGLLLLDINSGKLNENPFPHNRKINHMARYIRDNKGGIWFYDHTGVLRKYNTVTGELKELDLIPPSIVSVIDLERYNVFVDSHNISWITTYGNGLFRYDAATGALKNYRNGNDSGGPASNFLLSITGDRSGNLWIGSEYAGIIQ
ncbi:MAG: hypothetical protein HC905_31510 [Bacteroidales bacterium]|nr:hypothetical protein [Bacteroidales bacterium]